MDIIALEIVLFFSLKKYGFGIYPDALFVSVLAWVLSLYLHRHYRLRRYSRIPKTLQNIMRLSAIFVGTNVALQLFLRGEQYNLAFYSLFHGVFTLSLMVIRTSEILLIKRYRSLGKNYRNVVILGHTPDTRNLERNFSLGNELGYILHGLIPREKFDYQEFVQLSQEKEIDEVFISASQFEPTEYNQIISYADNNLIKIRVVPNFSGIYSSNLKLDYVGYQPILVHREIALDDIINSTIKRTFDIIFSLGVTVFVLSWLYPLMAILIKRESKGPVIFKQKRSGINNQDFYCYKFRSMAVNQDANAKQATKNDMRVTKIGRFIRKTSIDELPQFLNVLLGDMSVVGPRPHMVKHTEEFSNVVDRYMLRHFVKPGITGLAQTKGFRGETRTEYELRGRITLDRFYIENWNFFLDLKIIYNTLVNGIKGEDKAY